MINLNKFSRNKKLNIYNLITEYNFRAVLI